MTRPEATEGNKFGGRLRPPPWLLALSLAATLSLVAVSVWAGSYLVRAAILLQEAMKEADVLRARAQDRELARTFHYLAEGRLVAARDMEVPKETAGAHPHLLLVLEAMERATLLASQGNTSEFMIKVDKARSEASTFKAVLKQAGWELPVHY